MTVLSLITYRHLDMVSPSVILLMDNLKKVPPLCGKPVRQ